MRRGLRLVGMKRARIDRQKQAINVSDFKSHFGVHPVVLAQVWEDLQTEALINVKKRSVHLKNFLRSVQFLKLYETESVRKTKSGNTKKTVRKWCWYFVERIQALKAKKVSSSVRLLSRLTPFARCLSHLFHSARLCGPMTMSGIASYSSIGESQ